MGNLFAVKCDFSLDKHGGQLAGRIGDDQKITSIAVTLSVSLLSLSAPLWYDIQHKLYKNSHVIVFTCQWVCLHHWCPPHSVLHLRWSYSFSVRFLFDASWGSPHTTGYLMVNYSTCLIFTIWDQWSPLFFWADRITLGSLCWSKWINYRVSCGLFTLDLIKPDSVCGQVHKCLHFLKELRCVF